MEKLSKEEQKFKRAFKKAIKELSECGVEWYLIIRKFQRGGYHFLGFHKNLIGKDHDSPWIKCGECTGKKISKNYPYWRPQTTTNVEIKQIILELDELLEQIIQ